MPPEGSGLLLPRRPHALAARARLRGVRHGRGVGALLEPGTGRSARGSGRCGAPALLLATLVAVTASAAEPPAPGRFAIQADTVMPHLEENLRYARVEQAHCLAERPLASAFPVLAHPSLAGCALRDERRDGDEVRYRLACDGDAGTDGEARWRLHAGHASGTLEVRLGGKNMTFSQRVSLRRTGDCAAP